VVSHRLTEQKGKAETRPATLGVPDCQEVALGIDPPIALLTPVDVNVSI
jgi:hypothetical protein